MLMSRRPLPNVRSKNVEKERRRVLKALAKTLDNQEKQESSGTNTLQQGIAEADKALFVAVRQLIANSVGEIQNLTIPDEEKLKETEKILNEWKNQINEDLTINPSVRTILFEYCDQQYRTAVNQYAGNTDTRTKGQFDPEKFKTKVKTTIYDKIATKVTNLPGMGKIDAFLAFAGQDTLSSKLNQKLGNVFNKDVSEVADVRNRVAAARQVVSPLRVDDTFPDTDEGLSPQRAASRQGGGVATVSGGVASTQAIRLLTDIRDMLVKQFKFDQDTQKEHEQDQADAELNAEAASESADTTPVRVDDEMSENDTQPSKNNGGLVGSLVKGGTKKVVSSAVTKLAGRLAPTAAMSLVPGVASAGGAAAAGSTAAAGAASGGMFAALSASIGGIVAALGPILLALAGIAAAVYVVYKIWKNIDFTPILAPLAKGFGLLKDVVMTVWPLFKSIGKLLFTAIITPFKMVGFVIGKLISLLLKASPALELLIDGFTWLWQKAIKPMLEGITKIFTLLSDILEDPLGFLRGTGKFAKKEQPAGPQGQGAGPQAPPPGAGPGPGAATPGASPGGRGAGPGPVGAPNSSSGVLSSLSSKIKGNFGGQATAGGPTHPGVAGLAREVVGVPGFKQFTSFNDNFHQGVQYASKHKTGLAMDFTLTNPDQSPQAVAAVQNIAKKYGITGLVVKDEYKNPSSKATAGHIHVQFNDEAEASKLAAALGISADPSVPMPSAPGGAPAAPQLAGGTGPTAPATPASPTSSPGAPVASRAAGPIAEGTAATSAGQAMMPAMVIAPQIAKATAPPPAPVAMPIPIPVKARTDQLFAYQTINAV